MVENGRFYHLPKPAEAVEVVVGMVGTPFRVPTYLPPTSNEINTHRGGVWMKEEFQRNGMVELHFNNLWVGWKL